MNFLQRAIQILYFRVRLDNQEEALVIYKLCETIRAVTWMVLAASFFVTNGTSFTFNFYAGVSHCYLLIELLGISVGIKVAAVITSLQARQYFRKISFLLAVINDLILPPVNAVVVSELLVVASTFPQFDFVVGISCISIFCGFLFRILSELINSSYLLTNSAPGRRMPSYWNVPVEGLLWLAITL